MYIYYWHVLSFTGSCSLGWKRSGSKCFFYNVGSVSNSNAKKTCREKNAVLMTNDQIDVEFISQVTKYRDVDGSNKFTSIWLNAETNDINANLDTCRLLTPTATAYYETIDRKCDDLYPFICSKTAIVRCKNYCFQQGQCMYTTCICHQGWEGDDCSKYHCRDVNNCNGKGQCVGPNVCKCEDGWSGRACSASYCPRYKNCNLCVNRLGCGWCDTTGECFPGTARELHRTIGNCPDWFYYKCASPEESSTCSNHIETISCSSRYCNDTNNDFSLRLCQNCRDLTTCYQTTGTCHTWDEEKCPGGIAYTDYEDTTHTSTASFHDNVHVIDPADRTLYYCPYKLSSNEDDTRNLFIAKFRFPFDVNEIIVSAQSEGIMHKIDYKIDRDPFTFFTAIPVGLSDILKTANIKVALPPGQFMDIRTQESEGDKELSQKFLQSSVTIEESVLVFDSTTPVFKCAGHIYGKDKGILGSSFYLVVQKNMISTEMSVGNIIISENTSGYLETVIDVFETSTGTYVVTNLTHCSPEDIPSIDIVTLHIPSISCYGGNGWPGLLHFNDTVSEDSVRGKSIPGRKSGESVAKIIDIVDREDFVFIEVVNIEYIENKAAALSADVGDFVPEFRREDRSMSNFSHAITKTILLDVSTCMFHINIDKLFLNLPWINLYTYLQVAGSIYMKQVYVVDATMDIIIRSTWNWLKLRYDWDYSISVGGSVDINCTADFNLTAQVSLAGEQQISEMVN